MVVDTANIDDETVGVDAFVAVPVVIVVVVITGVVVAFLLEKDVTGVVFVEVFPSSLFFTINDTLVSDTFSLLFVDGLSLRCLKGDTKLLLGKGGSWCSRRTSRSIKPISVSSVSNDVVVWVDDFDPLVPVVLVVTIPLFPRRDDERASITGSFTTTGIEGAVSSSSNS